MEDEPKIPKDKHPTPKSMMDSLKEREEENDKKCAELDVKINTLKKKIFGDKENE